MRTGRARLLAAALALAAAAGCGSAGTGQAPGPVPAGPAPASEPAPTGAGDARARPDTAPPPPSCVDTALARLDPAERAAQLIMVGVPVDGVTGAAGAALDRAPGGVILTDAESGADPSSAEVRATVDDVRGRARGAGGAAGRVGLLVATDQEGGTVQDLDGPGFDTMPAAEVQGRDPAGLRRDAARWGAQLARAGVDVDLAPVADVVDPRLGEANGPVGELDRGFGTEAGEVAPAVEAFVRGMDVAGVATTLKHFPGLGKVRENTDFAGGVVDPATARDDPDLASFRRGIEAGAGLVMMSSARYPRLDPENRALFSPAIMRDLLRGDLGFPGVIMTDDVGAAAALADVPVGRRATDFVSAGGDLVLTIRPTDVARMVAALREKATDEPAFRATLDDSVRRVLHLKQDRGLLRC